MKRAEPEVCGDGGGRAEVIRAISGSWNDMEYILLSSALRCATFYTLLKKNVLMKFLFMIFIVIVIYSKR